MAINHFGRLRTPQRKKIKASFRRSVVIIVSIEEGIEQVNIVIGLFTF